MGFEPVTLRDAQTAMVSEVEIASHGSGIRCVLPILAALTSPDIKYLLIDEPELSLEARAQRVLKELLLEAAQAGRTVLVATQSHIFLNKDNVSCNYVVINQGARLDLEQVSEKEKLLDLTFNLLGNSLEDLFFPSNFLIVEGSSDQVVCEKVATLLRIPTGRVKIISAQGIDNVSDAYKSIKNTLVPLLADHSPYSKRVVVLLDRPSSDASRSVDEIQNALKERCIVLDEPSLEEYVPEDLFDMAGRNKAFDLDNLKEKTTEHKYAKKDETLKALRELKKEISSALATALRHEDLDKIPKIRDAVKLASDRAYS
jgi:predicted ATP-dependent endonuclease of OLD family